MSDVAMWIAVAIAFILLFRFLFVGGKSANEAGSVLPPEPESPEESERRDTAMLKLEQQRQATKQKLMEADLESDPKRAAKTLSRLMKKK